MTEAQWHRCTRLDRMLQHLQANAIVSARRLRLFACACCRRVGPLLDEPGRRAIQAAESFADGRATPAELEKEHAAANRWYARSADNPRGIALSRAVLLTTAPGAFFDNRLVVEMAALTARAAGQRTEPKAQRKLLADLFGNPFRPASFNSEWRTWQGSTVVKLTQVIYNECRFEGLPVVADALEEAGCTSAAMLGHCRSGGEHARGCWLVDAVLGNG